MPLYTMAIQRKWCLKPSCRARAYGNQIRPSYGSCGLEDDLAATYPPPVSSLQLSLFRILDVLSPYTTRPPRSGQTTNKTLWAVLLRATPNPVSRISHLHCALQKTRADPVPWHEHDTNIPHQLSPSSIYQRLTFTFTVRQNTFANFSVTSIGCPLLSLQYIQYAPSTFLNCIVP